MLNDRKNQPGNMECAYTAPVEPDASTAFQFHSDLTPPSVQKCRRKWLTAIVCTLLVLMCLALAITIFLLRYQIIFRNDSGGVGFQIVRRESAVITPDAFGIERRPAEERSHSPSAGVGDYVWR